MGAGVIIRDRREPALVGSRLRSPNNSTTTLSPAPHEPYAELLPQKEKRKETMKFVTKAPTKPMIALKGFWLPGGAAKRGQRFIQHEKNYKHYIRRGLAMDDILDVRGVTLDDCFKLARAGHTTRNEIFKLAKEALVELGLSESAVTALSSPAAEPVSPPPSDDFSSIDGIGKASVEKLHKAGILTFDDLRSVEDSKLATAGIPNAALGAIRLWRSAGDDEAAGDAVKEEPAES